MMSKNSTLKMNLVFVYLVFVSLFFYSCERDSYGSVDDTNNIKNYAEYELEEQEFKLLKIVDGLNKPWGLTFTNEENVLITEKGGRIIRVNLPSGRSFEVLHNIDSIEEGQGGLLDILYHEGYLYFSYTQDKGSGKTTTSISRGKLINDEVVELELLFSAIPAIKSGKHFGCRLAIRDDMLYATIGERGQGMIAQDPTQHPGSIIRINLNGSIPNSNPKFNGKSDWLPEIYQIGVRNPQGMALSPTNGEIFLDNSPISKIPPYEREIGMVFQNYALFPHMTVSENLSFPLEVRKISKTETQEKVKKVLEMVELGDFATRFPAQLSGGQQQRVALARALVFEPRLVLMDEPLGALDKNLREQMQYEIKHIHERIGITVVYVTHDQSEALTMSNRIAVFNDGMIQQLSSPDVLYEKPENSFVAQFIGENNRMTGTIKSIDDKYCSVDLDGGGSVKALKVNIGNVGEKTQLSVRPERVSVNFTPDKNENTFNGLVKELIYLGDHIRARLEVCGNDEFIVKIPNEGNLYIKENESIELTWSADDIRALDMPR